MKIAFCVPCFDGPKFEFFKSFSDLLVAMRDYPAEIRLFSSSGLDLVDARNELAEAALNWGADWLQWFDADHKFPPDATLRLLAHEKLLVGCNYAKRRNGAEQVASNEQGTLWTTREKAEAGLLEPASASGFGMVLVSAEVFAALGQPWFLRACDQRGRTTLGEDSYFYSKAAQAGYTLLIDHALSWDSAHIGEIWLQCALGNPLGAKIDAALSTPNIDPGVRTLLRALKAR